jgi:prepilin-type N-terminal cleavage/methylation domain-containing protein
MDMSIKKRGFTLVEIMIVLAIIMIIAVIAIPAMLRGKITGNETGAVAGVRAISNAANLYLFQNSVFPADLSALVKATPPYINPDLANTSATHPKSGYYYSFDLEGGSEFRVTTRPSVWRVTGTKCFSADQTGKIMYCDSDIDCQPNLDF